METTSQKPARQAKENAQWMRVPIINMGHRRYFAFFKLRKSFKVLAYEMGPEYSWEEKETLPNKRVGGESLKGTMWL